MFGVFQVLEIIWPGNAGARTGGCYVFNNFRRLRYRICVRLDVLYYLLLSLLLCLRERLVSSIQGCPEVRLAGRVFCGSLGALHLLLVHLALEAQDFVAEGCDCRLGLLGVLLGLLFLCTLRGLCTLRALKRFLKSLDLVLCILELFLSGSEFCLHILEFALRILKFLMQLRILLYNLLPLLRLLAATGFQTSNPVIPFFELGPEVVLLVY